MCYIDYVDLKCRAWFPLEPGFVTPGIFFRLTAGQGFQGFWQKAFPFFFDISWPEIARMERENSVSKR